MKRACLGKCVNYKASRSTYLIGGQKYGRYDAGQKRCSICDIFIRCDGIYCPCCGSRLRMKMHSLKKPADHGYQVSDRCKT